RCAGHITAAHLSGFEEPGAAPVVRLDDIPNDRPRVLLSSRAVLDWSALRTLPEGAALLRAGDAVIGCSLPPGAANPHARWIESPSADGSQVVQVNARVLQRVWELVSENPAQITRDHEARGDEPGTTAVPHGTDALGYADGTLRHGPGVTIEPN